MNLTPASPADVSTLELDDEELIRKVRAAPEGDLRPFEQLMLRYQKRVIANCRYITHDPNNAGDLAQEVMVKVFFAINSFEGKSSLSISCISPCFPYEVLKTNTNALTAQT
jgi:hypothetical protein